LGIEWVELPGLAIQTIDNRIYAYPDGMEYEKESIFSWVSDVFNGNIKDFPEDGDVLMADPMIGEMLLNETK
jgi:hypothetical protein